MAQQPSRELSPAVSTTGGRDGEIQRHQEPAEVCSGSRLDTQPLKPDRHLNRRDIFKHNRAVALAEWRELAA